jgi:predicted TIM-barrel fold metal-dependent hydrolase
VLVGMHASDDGAQRYINEWDGKTSDFNPFVAPSTFSQLVNSEYRGIRDTIYSIIGHGLATRFPDLRFMPIENGSQWVPTALKQFQKLYERSPQTFDEDPMVAFHRSIVIHPFFEEDVMGIVELVGVDKVVFGSDYPHPEGLYDPLSFVDEIEPLTEEDKAKVMGGTLSRLMGCDPAEKVVATV